MTFFPEPLRPSEGRQDDEYRVNPIEADPQPRESFNIEEFEELERKKRVNLYGAFLVYFKKLLDRFDTSKQGTAKAISNEGLPGNLKEFKVLLGIIQDLDQSENSSFCQQLSEAWVRLLQDAQVSSISKRSQEIDLKKLSLLMTDIDHYPPNEEHRLGYYLSNYAGETWLPLPFRDILKQLYSDHVVNQKNSILSKWVQMIEDLLQS
ncbi:MAG: hypothetical protein H7A41_01735 [Chlamydiales bacterium]|nr:hypothetical protein [Simkania sp.]MCP5503852.1 hypothetical protein [Chlamydiales bacterium]